MRDAAVIPHWNRVDLLRTLLENLKLQTRPFDEIIVVDNGSTDGSADLAEEIGARTVRLDKNYGFARAVNSGVMVSDTEFVAILNNDVTLDPKWVAELLRKNAAFATGKILTSRDHSTLDGAWDEISRAACPVRIGAGVPDGPLWNTPRTIPMASMTACLVRRDAFTAIGALDERFGSYLEDVDFGLRCAKAGLTGVYEPAAVAYHQGSSTWGRWNPDTVRLLSRNQVLLFAKHFRGQPLWPIVAGQLLWGLVALRHGCGWAWLQGKLAGRRLSGSIQNETLDPQAFAGFLRASEAAILERCYETYWRVYAWLAPLR